MQLDFHNQYIARIAAQLPLANARLLEIGCGDGRITRELISRAREVVATELSAAALERARRQLNAENLSLVHTPDGFPQVPGGFDAVLYTLSLHHIPSEQMLDNLRHCAGLLTGDGKILVIEPGERGAFMEIKKTYGAGSGDEGPQKQAALDALQRLSGWTLVRDERFFVTFQFDDSADFIAHKLPDPDSLTAAARDRLQRQLQGQQGSAGILLDAERRLLLLGRKTM